MAYRKPTEDEKLLTLQLVGSKISIFWDGDNVYYPCKISKYNQQAETFDVIYEGDDTEEVYNENLKQSQWLIFDESLPSAQDETNVEGQLETNKSGASKASKKKTGPRLTYMEMVIRAVIDLNEKDGSSIQAIRKYVLTHFELKKQQTASFNSLTLKALSHAVAKGELDHSSRGKHSYKLSTAAKKKLEAKSMAGGQALSQKNQRRDEDNTIDPWLQGTPVHHNKHLRQLLLQTRKFRDAYLSEPSRMDILSTFLPPKNYFTRHLKHNTENTDNSKNTDTDKDDDEDDDDDEEEEASEMNGDDTEKEDDINGDVASNTEQNIDKKPRLTMSTKSTKSDIAVVADSAVSKLMNVTNSTSVLKDVPLLTAPTSVRAELHTHQLWGISWMVHMFSHGMPIILGDQMGLGKTIQSIAFLCHLRDVLGFGGPHLIVVPLSVLSNWLSEIERFAPTLRTVRFHGPKPERNRIKKEEMNMQEFDICVTTYEVCVGESQFLKKRFMWTSLIIDEGHRLKNAKSRLSEKLRSISALHKVILTGTPVQNNMTELWALLHFLVPDIFTPSSMDYFSAGFDPSTGQMNIPILQKAKALLDIFMLRRVKSQVNIKLPSKKEFTLLVPLTERQKILYKHLLGVLDENTAKTLLGLSTDTTTNTTTTTTDGNGNDDSGKTASSSGKDTLKATEWRVLMNLLMQLRKVCNHTYLLDHGDCPDPYTVDEHIVHGSGKLMLLDRLLPRLQNDGHRVLIFSQFTSTLDILEDYCHLRDYSYARLDGETSRVRRRLEVRRFNQPKSNLFIFLISTRAGGLGLNLATADTVILYDSDWNPQMDLQATERTHRIGQTKPVRVYRLICRGSVEQRMVLRAERKMLLSEMVAESRPEDDTEDGEVSPRGDSTKNTGPGMSQRELMSVLRDGMTAILAGNNDDEKMSDEQLDMLLERNGRDNAMYDAKAGDNEKVVDTCGDGKAVGIDEVVLSTLPEVDLRQLEDVIYKKQDITKSRSGNNLAYDETVAITEWESEEIVTKRVRKERIVMVSGQGTGYGGMVPILADSLDDTTAVEADVVPRRSTRAWEHMHFCCLCGHENKPIPPKYYRKGGKSKKRVMIPQEPEAIGIKCSHCPFVFHESCLREKMGSNVKSGMYVCCHHKCAICNRATSAAGGLLFRCNDCFTAYCEDCLPQDEVVSVGRCRNLEAYDYDSKQAYFIHCPPCASELDKKSAAAAVVAASSSAVTALKSGEYDGSSSASSSDELDRQGILQDSSNGDRGKMEDKESAESAEDEEAQEEQEVLLTQTMKIIWDEVLPEQPEETVDEKEESTDTTTKGKKKNKKAKLDDKNLEIEGGSETEDVEGDGDMTPEEDKIVIADLVLTLSTSLKNPCTLSQGLDALCTHDVAVELLQWNETSYKEKNNNMSSNRATGIDSNVMDVHVPATSAGGGVELGEKEWKAIKMMLSEFENAITNIRLRVDRGRYRSVNAFIVDIRTAINSLMQACNKKKDVVKQDIRRNAKGLLDMFEEYIASNLCLYDDES